MQIIFTDGLGNQMFQYALYLALKAKGRNPKINIGIACRSKVHSGFELCKAFQIDKTSLPIVMDGCFLGGVTIFFTRHIKSSTCAEDVGCFNNNIYTTHKLFISGYWQNIHYFEDVQDEVRKAFSFRNIDERNKALEIEMSQCNSISLHIRRGDYLKYPQFQVCTPSYYKRAVNYISTKVENPMYYVFSDDLDWSDQFMKELGVKYKLIDFNRGRASYKDMFLMTCCQHNILANSSFSWWGAWLGKQNGKIVICPQIWKTGSKLSPQLDSWIKLEA